MEHRYLRNVVTLTLNADKCTCCGMCTDVCPHAVLEVAQKKVRLRDRDRCMECGACALNCPVGAIAVNTGVGCAYALIKSALTGGEPSCGCSSSGTCC